jgi:uncharacterized membrane protein
MSVDPVDDCTFYYTNQYIPANGTFNWRTRIASFKLSPCGGDDFSLSASPSSLTLAQGAGGTSTITVTPTGAFAGAVDLSISGVPAGATASFSPTTTTSTSTLTIGAGTAVPGTYSLTVTGISGALTHTTTVALTVTGPPDFALSANPASVSATQGNSTTTMITVTPQNGFNGAVDLSVSGLPSGATGSFNPVTTSTTSVLTLGAGTATPGTYVLTVTGTSGALTHSISLTFVVNPAVQPSFSISAAPASQTIRRRQSTTYTVTITRSGGFTGAVALSLSGQGSGVTGTFSPSSVTGTTSTLTISAANNAARGTRTLTITGSSAGVPSTSTTVSLTVTR